MLLACPFVGLHHRAGLLPEPRPVLCLTGVLGCGAVLHKAAFPTGGWRPVCRKLRGSGASGVAKL